MDSQRSERFSNDIIDSIDALVYEIQYGTYRIVYANRMVRKAFPDFETGDICYHILFGREQPCENCPMSRLQAGEPDVGAAMWVEKLGKWLQFEYNVCTEESGAHYCVCTAVDITEVKESVSMTERVLDGIRAAAYTVGMKDYRIRSINQQLRSMLPEIEHNDLCYQALWGKDEPCSHCPIPTLSAENPYGKMEIFNEKLNRFLSIDSVRIEAMNGDPAVIFTGYDITKRMEYENKLKGIAYNDIQLNIKNRMAFMDDLAEMYEKGEAGKVCMVNIKNFNSFNLVYGRALGDTLLKALADYFVSIVPEVTLYRVGGAKFAFIARSEAAGMFLEQQIGKPFPASVLGDNWNFRLYSDAVLIDFPQFAPNPEILIHNAEYMLQKTKKTDSSEVKLFQMVEQERLERSNQITLIMRDKLSQGEFQVYYQPLMDIEKGGYSKCEALLRLYDKELGWILPAEFIPIAEESGLINDLGMFVLEKACQLIASRSARGLNPIQVNVNVSTVEFSRSSFYNDVVSIVGKYQIDASLIQLEVTESITINSFEYILDIMKRLIEFGITFAVDDFGTGYSSLSYIGTLPVEGIKLDKSFVDKIVESEVYVLIVKNVIEIAKGLKFKIVAEGVETQSQYEMLKRLGCDYIQGYLFSKPLPEQEFDQFMLDH